MRWSFLIFVGLVGIGCKPKELIDEVPPSPGRQVVRGRILATTPAAAAKQIKLESEEFRPIRAASGDNVACEGGGTFVNVGKELITSVTVRLVLSNSNGKSVFEKDFTCSKFEDEVLHLGPWIMPRCRAVHITNFDVPMQAFRDANDYEFIIQRVEGVPVTNLQDRDHLFAAVAAGRPETIEVIAKLPDHANMVDDKSKITLAHMAFLGGNEKILNALDKKGTDFTRKNKRGVQPIHLAGFSGSLAPLEFAKRKKMDFEAVTEKNRTPLIMACRYGSAKPIIWLIRHGAKVNVRDSEGYTMFNHLVSLNPEFVMEVLPIMKRARFDPNEWCSDQLHPLHFATSAKMVDWLIANGAKVDAFDKGGQHLTPLHSAVIAEDEEVVKALLKHHANPHLATISGYTAADMAVQVRNQDIERIIRGAMTQHR